MGGKRYGTHVGLDVEVLKIESVLPHVDTDDGDQVQQRVLVGGGGDLQTLASGVQALNTKVSRYRSSPV